MDSKKYVFRATVNVTGCSWYFGSIDAVYNKYFILCNALGYRDPKSLQEFGEWNWRFVQSLKVSHIGGDGTQLVLHVERIPLSM